VSVHTLAIHPASMFAPAAPARRLSLVPPAATPTRPEDVALVVTRFEAGAQRGTCALCWTGPSAMAGSVRQRGALGPDAARPICSRCLVTLEMLAVQFVPHVRLCIETPA
jgi:hypothetical protein